MTYATYIGSDGKKKTGLVSESGWEPLKQYYDEMYNRETTAASAEAEKARQEAQERLQQELGRLEQERRGQGRRLYRDYMQTRKNLDATLAARGYTGGLSETGHIALNTGYQEKLAAGERQSRAQAEQARKTAQESQRRAEDTLRRARERAQAQRAEGYADIFRKMQEEKRWAAQKDTSRENMEYSRLLERAQSLAKYGNFSGFLALGYTPQEVEAMWAVWKAQNPKLP